MDCLASPELPSPSIAVDKSLDKACFNSTHIHKELENFTAHITIEQQNTHSSYTDKNIPLGYFS